METNPAPDSPEYAHIERIEKLAAGLLEKASSEQVMMSHLAPFGSGYNLELRATASRADQEDSLFFGRDDSRYTYLWENGHCRPIMSLDLNDVRQDGEPHEPLYSRPDVLYALAEAELQDVSPQHKELIWVVHGLARAICEGRPTDPLGLQNAERLFTSLMDNSLTVTHRTYFYTLQTGQELGLASMVYEGNLAHARPHMLDDERLGISVEDGNRRVIFEKLHNGQYETYAEVGDPAEILAALVDAGNVDRNEDGAVISVEHTGREYPAARAAERAALGLPRVQLTHLQLIRAVLEKVQP